MGKNVKTKVKNESSVTTYTKTRIKMKSFKVKIVKLFMNIQIKMSDVWILAD